MTKFFVALFAVGMAVATISTADAAQNCGRGRHRNMHGYCVRNRPVAMMRPPMMAPPPPPPTYTQQITPPARTGIIPGSANSAHSVCSYGFHPGPNGQCQPN
jgi:hypothetical protein